MIGMKVCSIMADSDGGRRQPYDDGSQQEDIWQQTADPVEMLAVCSDISRYSRTQQIHSRALQVGRRVSGCRVSGRNSLRAWILSGLHRAKSGGISSEKKAF